MIVVVNKEWRIRRKAFVGCRKMYQSLNMYVCNINLNTVQIEPDESFLNWKLGRLNRRCFTIATTWKMFTCNLCDHSDSFIILQLNFYQTD